MMSRLNRVYHRQLGIGLALLLITGFSFPSWAITIKQLPTRTPNRNNPWQREIVVQRRAKTIQARPRTQSNAARPVETQPTVIINNITIQQPASPPPQVTIIQQAPASQPVQQPQMAISPWQPVQTWTPFLGTPFFGGVGFIPTGVPTFPQGGISVRPCTPETCPGTPPNPPSGLFPSNGVGTPALGWGYLNQPIPSQ